MAFGTVDNDSVKIKLFGNADGGTDIVGAVRVEMRLDPAFQDRQQRLAFHIKFRRIGVLILLGFFQIFLITFGLQQLFPDDGRNGHTGYGCFLFAVINLFGIFPQREFHGRGRGKNHLIHIAAGRVHDANLPCNGIGAARPDGNGGDTVFQSFAEGAVSGIYGIDRANLRGAGVGHLVGIVPLKVQAAFPDTNVAVRIDKAGSDQAAGGIKQLRVSAVVASLPYFGNQTVLHHDITFFNDSAMIAGIELCVDDNHALASFLQRKEPA